MENTLRHIQLPAHLLLIVGMFSMSIASEPAWRGDDTRDHHDAPKSEARITLRSPVGGESWSVGSQHSLTWQLDGGASEDAVTIECTTDGGGNWTVLAAAVPSNGKFLWKVPETISSHCRIRLAASKS